MNPPDEEDLADFMGLPDPDLRCQLSIDAAIRYVEKRRHRADPAQLWLDADVNLGALQYGALLYLTKSAPGGLPEYDEFQPTYGAAMAGIHRLIGGPDPAVS